MCCLKFSHMTMNFMTKFIVYNRQTDEKLTCWFFTITICQIFRLPLLDLLTLRINYNSRDFLLIKYEN